MNRLLVSSAAALLVAGVAAAQSARNYINIVGSSTVYPFTTTVAEQFGRAGKFKTPKVESTGTGGGIKLFCNGVGVQHPDVVNASRRIKPTEVETCAKNGVKDISEIKIGYDGIVLARSKTTGPLKLTRKDIYLALAKQIPDPANPHRADRQSEHHLEAGQPRAAQREDRSARAAADLGHPRCLRGTGHGERLLELRMDQGAEGCGRGPLQARLPQHPRGRRLRRSRRERQPDRPEDRSQPERSRHLRLQLPRGERGQAGRQPRRRSVADASRRSPRASTPPRARSSST